MSNASEKQTNKSGVENSFSFDETTESSSPPRSDTSMVASEDLTAASSESSVDNHTRTNVENGSNHKVMDSQEVEHSADNELIAPQNDVRVPMNLSPPEWIHEGAHILVADGKLSVPEKAKVLSEPHLVDNEWKVQVQWSHHPDWISIVDCLQCRDILASQRSKRARTQRSIYCSDGADYSKVIASALMEPSQTPTKTQGIIADSSNKVETNTKNKKQKSNHSVNKETPPTPNNSDNNRKQAPPVTNITARGEQEARDRTVRLLNMMPNEYPPGLMDMALESVGYPYGLQDVMHEIQKHELQAQLEECCSLRQEEVGPFKVKKDMDILEPCKGDLWEGRVLHEKPKRVKRDGKMVEVWDVEYEDESIWQRDEEQLRKYRFPRPGIAPCAGRNLQFLEVFAGTLRQYAEI